MEHLFLGTALAASVLILCFRIIGLRRMIRHNKLIDAISTVGFIIAGAGTLGGVAAAIIAGLEISFTLILLKKWHERIQEREENRRSYSTRQ